MTADRYTQILIDIPEGRTGKLSNALHARMQAVCYESDSRSKVLARKWLDDRIKELTRPQTPQQSPPPERARPEPATPPPAPDVTPPAKEKKEKKIKIVKPPRNHQK
jgi:outer membrane biosynthesis protein TonB